MPAPCPTHVRKRDGRVVPFDSTKIAGSIRAAALACGLRETDFASELSEAVALYLARAGAPVQPATDDIAAAIERVLSDTRNHAVANTYRSFRADREAARDRCRVVKPVQPSLIDAETALRVLHGGEQRSSQWDKLRIVQALEREAHVSRAVAEDIARTVQAKLLTADMRHVTTTLIRALVDNELLERGYTAALRQRSSVTVPFRDIERLAADIAPGDAACELGTQVLQAYTLTRLYSDDVAASHQRGMIHIGGLSHPFSRHSERVDVGAGASTLEQALAAVLPVLPRMAAHHTGRLAVCFSPGAPSGTVAECIETLAALAASFGVCSRVTAVIDAAEHAVLDDLAGRTVRAVEIITAGARLDAPAATAIARLTAQGWRTGWRPAMRVPAYAQRLTINLPQAVYRARERDLDGVIEELYRSLELCVQAHRQFLQYQESACREPLRNAAGCVNVAGLDEAVAILAGKRMFESVESDSYVRVLLRVLHTGLHQSARLLDLSAALTIGEPNRCARRLACIDQALFPEIFGFLPLQPEALEHAVRPYTTVGCNAETLSGPKQLDALARLRGYFDEGVTPVFLRQAGQDDLAGMATALATRQCPFVFCPSDEHAGPQAQTEGGLDMPGMPNNN
ncbi:hypothetical protein GX586_00125 [bacterium]|nr:hypothetical protein [bacterium]